MEFPPSEGIKDIIQEGSFSEIIDNEFAFEIGTVPSHPDRVIVLVDSGGFPANPRWLLDYPSVQLLVRGDVSDYKLAWAVIQRCKNAVLGITSHDRNGARWNHVNMLSDTAYLGKDQNDRPTFSVNFTLIIEPGLTPDTQREAL